MEESEKKINSSHKSILNESSIPKENRRKIRKKLSYIESLEQPGTIYNAEVHGSAQRLLKVHRITKYVKFCKCCSLPQETPGVVVPFNFFDKKTDFGLGIYLYFYYIKFCILMSFISICLASISTIVFSQQYSSDLNQYCDSIFNNNENLRNLDEDFIKDCTKFSSSNNESNSATNIIEVDWLISMSAHNIKNYHDIFKYSSIEDKEHEIEKVTLDYSLMYFITGITVLIVDYLFILHINLLDECQNFEETTPRDYTVLIHGVPKPIGDNDMKEELINIIGYVSMYTSPLQVYQIIPCLKIAEIFNIAQEKYEEETKLYHVYNFEKQKLLNKKYGFNQSNNNLHYFIELLCIKKKIPVQTIEKKILELKDKLNEKIIDLYTSPNKYNGGTFFLIFSTMEMRDNFYNYFPHSYGEKIYWYLRYFFECILFSFCVSEGRKNKIKSKIQIDVRQATEPYEVHWENMGYTRFERNLYKFISLISTVGLIIISLGIIIGLNKLQNKVSQNNFTGNTFLKYLLSELISIMLGVANIIGEIVLQKLTIMEKIEYKTSFYISFSMKLTVYTFIIIAILPIAANYINNHWGNNDLLVNNMLMIFITNILLPPILFYLSPGLAIKLYKRIKAKLDLKNVKLENSIYTQGELNEIFENPIMNISYKYSYITNVFMISLFYLSIFPIGMIIGFFALLFAYISEFFYIGLYKRPEILNSKLCKTYVYNFKWIVFIFSLGNYIFIGWISDTQPVNWSLTNLIVFFILCLIPYQSIKINTLGMTESESKKDTYEQNSIFFSTDYEKLNPFTRKQGFLRYFKKLLNENIIDEEKCKKIVEHIQNLNEMDSYLKTMRHMENFCATQELNNIYMRNKNFEKEQDIIKREFEKDKNDIEINKDDPEFLQKVIRIKDYLYSFSTTAAGISNALIFLDEKNINEEQNSKNYNKNYNPWKADWIFSESYLEKRKNLINEILENIDYRGEISDDEDTIINYTETTDHNLELIKNNNIINQDKDKENTKTSTISKNKKINIIKINDEDVKENNNINLIDNNKKGIIEEMKNDVNENISSEKSESILFNNNINKFKKETDKYTDNNFVERPDVFNYGNIQKDSSERSMREEKVNNEKNNENINNSFFDKKNKNIIFESSNSINENEQK